MPPPASSVTAFSPSQAKTRLHVCGACVTLLTLGRNRSLWRQERHL